MSFGRTGHEATRLSDGTVLVIGGSTGTVSPTTTATAELYAVDVTVPLITPTITGTLGDDGWYTSDVGLTWAVTDEQSAIESTSGCDAVSITADQSSTTYACSATSEGGTAGPVEVSIKRDATAPTVSVTGVTDGAVYPPGSAPTAGCDTQDARSGVAEPASLQSSGGPLGTVIASCTGATDEAGNAATTVSATYGVHYVFSGFLAPIDDGGVLNTMKAGAAVAVKFSLAGENGLAILAEGSPSSQTIDCELGTPTDAVEETVTAGSSSLSYDATSLQYRYVWKTDKAWAASCRRLNLTLIDGSSHTAIFEFTH